MPTPMKQVQPPAAAAAVMVEEENSNASSTKAEAWNCSCGKQWPAMQKRCGNGRCNKWKGGKRDAFVVHRPNAPSPPKKQPPQDGSNNSSMIKWTCHNCQHVMAGNKVRCGKCHRWKGGKRTLYKKTATVKNDSAVDIVSGASLSLVSGGCVGQHGCDGGALNNIANNNAQGAVKQAPYDTTQEWTCPHCSTVLPGKQTRCGKCFKWRGGKRQGGWTLKARKKSASGKDEEEEDGIDRTLDWTCCNVLLPAKQSRCGKCHKWRGGKRVFSGSNDDGGESKRVKSDESDEKVKAPPNNHQLKENELLEVSDTDVQQQLLLHPLANDRANIVFEYPIPFPPAVYPPSAPFVSAEEYYPLPSPIAVTNAAAAAAAAVVTNSAAVTEV